MVSIEDVAREAGVSKALVSRYLNGKPGVGPENRERIAGVVKRLGYRRNDLARSLVQQRTGAIGVVMDTICHPFFFELIRGLETGGQEAGYNIIFCDCMSDTDTKKKYIDYLSHGRVDGFIIYGSLFSDNSIIMELSGSPHPFVLVENDVPGVMADKILVDNRGGVGRMVRRLHGKGYRDIRMVCWRLDTSAGQERLTGFLAGMSACGLRGGADAFYRAGNAENTKAVINGLIDEGNLPDAFVFGADELAFAAIEVMEQRGVKIPGDVAVTGFDHDFYLSRERLMPRLTTLEQPLFEMGKIAVGMLAQRIADPSLPVRAMSYTVKLIEGETG